MFPVDSIGGGNKKDFAKRLLKIHPRGGEYVETDIDGEKNIFRKRSWIGAMFKRSGAIAGQYVSLQKDADGSYQVWIDASEGK